MKSPLTRLIAMTRTRARRHYLAMIRAERRDDWHQADKHHATLVNCVRLENYLVDTAQLSH